MKFRLKPGNEVCSQASCNDCQCDGCICGGLHTLTIGVLCLPPVLQVSGYEDILVETINLCCHYYENHMYMVAKEKYMLLKVCEHMALLPKKTSNHALRKWTAPINRPFLLISLPVR